MQYLFIDHETCGLARIPALAVRARAILAEANPAETAALITCHRAEIVTTSAAMVERIIGELDVRGIDDVVAAERRFAEIACGLRSHLAGEREILGQARRALADMHRDHPFVPHASRALAAAAVARTSSGFAAALDYADITAAIALPYAPRSVYVWGAGALGGALALAWRERGALVTLVSRNAKRARRRMAAPGITFASPASVRADEQPTLCLLATQDVDAGYAARVIDWISRSRVVACIDLCGPPLFAELDVPYVRMHDAPFEAQVARSNAVSHRVRPLAHAALELHLAGSDPGPPAAHARTRATEG